MKRAMLFWTAVFVTMMLVASKVLKLRGYEFRNRVKYASMVLSFGGIVSGTRQLLKNHRDIGLLLCMLEGVILIPLHNYLILVRYGREETAEQDGRKMVRVWYRSKAGEMVHWYDYKNGLIRGRQERFCEVQEKGADGPTSKLWKV